MLVRTDVGAGSFERGLLRSMSEARHAVTGSNECLGQAEQGVKVPEMSYVVARMCTGKQLCERT